MNAVIFGADGQDGFYLSEICEQHGVKVTGFGRSNNNGCLKGDVSDNRFVREVISYFKPAYVFHLAAVSTTRHEALFENHAAISTGTINILEAAKQIHPDTRIFITGSGVQFVNSGKPIKESDPFDPSSAYAVSRIESALWARYFRGLGLKAFIGYFFHHESPLRTSGHLSQQIVEAAKMASKGQLDNLNIIDPTVRKEAGFAGDIMEGVWTLVNQDNVSEAVIGTGITYSIADWLEVCFQRFNLDWRQFVTINPDNKQAEYKTLVSNPETMFSLGWKPKTGFEQLIGMMIE